MDTLPKRIRLTALKKQWKVSYVTTPGKLILIEHSHREIVLYGKRYSKRAALHIITRWVRLKASVYLEKLMKQINRRVKVKYKKLVIGSHEYQWGSCSSAKSISLNYKIIFLPAPLMKNVIIHELCHCRYLSHSEAFWKEVAKYDRQWKKHKRELNEGDAYIPWWVD